jgi:transcriptional regulator with XRE-family HTH domain
METELRNFRQFIKEACKNAGILQKQFAKLIGVSEEGFSKVMMGKKPISNKLIGKIAKAFGVDPIAIIYKITKRDVILCSSILKSFTDRNYNHGDIEHKLHNIGRKMQDKLIKDNALNKLFK